MVRKLKKDEKGFTGLEAAITLIAFVIVAAVFSYVVLNMGFFTTQKSQQVTKTGLEQASSSLELAGDIIGHGDANSTGVATLTIYVQSTAGGEPIDLTKTTISYTSSTWHAANVTAVLSWTQREDTDDLLEPNEQAKINITVPSEETLGVNKEFTVEIKPPSGATLTIVRRTPAAIDTVMDL
jgi:flagellin FlaB